MTPSLTFDTRDNVFTPTRGAYVEAAWNDFQRFAKVQTVVAGGAGLRYELSRKYGIHIGVDVAVGPADPAIYLQVGSAWVRP